MSIRSRWLKGLLSLAVLGQGTLGAATYTWDGGGGNTNWNTGANWVGDVSPPDTGTHDIVFQSDQGNTTIYPWLSSNTWDINSLTINGTGGNTTSYQQQGGTIAIGTGGYTNTANNWQLFNAEVVIAGNQTWTNNMVTQIILDIDVNGSTLDINGTQAVILKTWNAGTEIRGAGTVNINGELVTENDNSAWTGTFNVNNGGKLTIGESDGLGTTANGTTIASGGQLILDEVGHGNLVIGAEAISVGGSGHDSDGTGAIRSLDGTNSIAGAITLTADTTLAVDSGTLTLSGVVDDGASSFAINKTGTGALTFTGTNTYSGNLILNAGTTNVNSGGDLDNVTNVILADDGGENATLTITGAGSTVDAANIFVGEDGTGTLTMNTSGVATSSTDLKAGVNAGSIGVINVDGSGTSITATGNGVIGNLGNGTINMTNSAAITIGGFIDVGKKGTGVGTLNIDSGSDMIISGGGGTGLMVGWEINGASGEVNVDGSGSTLTVSGTSQFERSDNAGGATKADLNVFNSGVATFNGNVDLYNGSILTLGYNESNASNGSGTINGTGTFTNHSGSTITGNGSISNGINLEGGTFTNLGAADILTLSGIITDSDAGNESLTKNGAGRLVITGNSNTYGGSTLVNDGTLEIEDADSLGDTGANTTTTVSSGATLAIDINGTNTIDNENFTISGTGDGSAGAIDLIDGDVTISGTIALAADSTIDVSSTADNLILTGVVSGANALTVTGNGLLSLNANNTYTGLTTVDGGKVELNHNNGLGDASGDTLVQGGGELRLSGTTVTPSGETLTLGNFGGSSTGQLKSSSSDDTQWSGNVVVAYDSKIRFNGTSSNDTMTIGTASSTTIDIQNSQELELDVDNTDTSSNMTVVGQITDTAGAGSLLKSGDGIAILTADNDYSGATTVSDGTLEIQHLDALGDSGASTSTTVSDGATLNLKITGGGTLDNEAITISGAGHSSGGALKLDAASGNITLSSALTLGANATVNVEDAADKLTSSTSITDGGGTFNLTKIGAGRFDIDTAHAVDGTTTINAGTLAYSVNNTTSNWSLGDTSGTNSATLLLDATGTWTNGTITVNTGSSGTKFIGTDLGGAWTEVATYGGNITLNDDVSFTGNNTTSTSIDGIVSGTGDLTIDANTSGLIYFQGDNTYSGTTHINNGIFSVGHADALGDTGAATTTNVASGAELLIEAANLTIDNENFNIAGTGHNNEGAIHIKANTHTISGTVTMTADSQIRTTGNLTISGIVDDGVGTYNLTSDGDGTLVLSADNTYGGTTNISNGILEIGHEDSLGNTGAATSTVVTSGATLQLNIGTNNQINNENYTIGGTGHGGIGAIYQTRVGWNQLNGTATLTADTTLNAVDDGSFSILGIVDDGGNNYDITKIGDGQVMFQGDNTFGGQVLLTDGFIEVEHVDGLGDTGATTNTTVSDGASLIFDVNGTVDNESFNIQGIGDGWQGAIKNNKAGSTLRLSGTVTLDNDARVLTQAADATTYWDGIIDDGVGTYTMGWAGFGKNIVTADNTYGGTTTIHSGTLEVQHLDGLADTGANTSTVVTSGTALVLNIAAGGILGNEEITISGDGTGSEGALALAAASADVTLSSIVTLGANATISVDDSADTLTLGSGITDGASSFSLTKIGAGELHFDADPTINGTTTVNAGTVYYSAGNSNSAISLGNTSGTDTAGIFIDTNLQTVSTAITVNSGSSGIKTIGTDLPTAGWANSGTYSGTITLNDSVTFKTNHESVTNVTNIISGTGDVNVDSALAGVLVFSGDNTYSGTTNVDTGVLEIQHSDALGNTGAATSTVIDSGGELKINSAAALDIQNENFSIAGTGYLNEGAIFVADGGTAVHRIRGNVDLTANSLIKNLDTLRLEGVISDSGGTYTLTKTGSAELRLEGNNTYDGQTIVTEGDLRLHHNNALGTTTGNTRVTSTNGGTDGNIILRDSITVAEDFLLEYDNNGAAGYSEQNQAIKSTNGNNTLTGDITLDRTGTGVGDIAWELQTEDATSLSVSGNISGAASGTQAGNADGNQLLLTALSTGYIDISGVIGNGTIGANGLAVVVDSDGTAGNVDLSGTNTYTGSTIIRSGSLTAEADALVSTNSAFGNSSASIELSDSGSAAGDDVLLLIGGAYTIARTVDVNNNNSTGNTTLGGSTAHSSTFSGNIDFEASRALQLTAAASGTTTISGLIADGANSGSLEKIGAGKVILSNDNTFDGSVTITTGTLEIQHQDALGDQDTGAASSTTVSSGATLALNNAAAMTIIDEDISIAGTGDGGAGAIDVIDGSHTLGDLSVGDTLTLTAHSTIDVGSADDTLTLNMDITDGAGDYNITKTGLGTLALAASSNSTNWQGDLTINGGTVRVGANSTMTSDTTTAPLVTVASGARWQATGATHWSGTDLVDFNIAGTGTANNGAIDIDAGGTIRGDITLSGDALIHTGDSSAIMRFQNADGGTLALSTHNLTLTSGANNVEFIMPMTGSGDFTVNGTGTVDWRNTTTWTGDVYVEGSAILDHNSSNMIADSSDVYVRDGATWQLDFFGETIDQLTLQGGATVTNNSWNDLTVANTAGNAISVSGGASNTAVISMTTPAQGQLNLNGTTTTIDVDTGKTLRIDGEVQNGAITKTGDGTLELGNDTIDTANTFTGGVTVNGGTLLLSRNDGTDTLANQTITVGAGAELLLGNNNQINDSADLVLGGGTFDAAGYDETLDNLTLTANSIIDMGSGNSVLDFTGTIAGLVDGGDNAQYTLSVWNWDGTPIVGGGTDQLIFSTDTLTNNELKQIVFYSDSGSTLYDGNIHWRNLQLASGEVVPAPEPSTWFAGFGLVSLIAWHWRRRLRAKSERS